MVSFTTRFLLSLAFALFVNRAATVWAKDVAATEFSADQIEFFEKEIRPILSEKCLDCHSGKKAKVGLELDHRAGWLRGSDYREVLSLSSLDDSPLIHAITGTRKLDTTPMPEKGEPLSPQELEKLKSWLTMGLPWPYDTNREQKKDPREHWSFSPIQAPTLPNEFAGNPIDYFLEQRQTEEGVQRAPRADRYTLLRRVYFDLIGLPPSYAEYRKFADDPNPEKEALAKVVKELLASPHYGERWARHWMDVARYSDTIGYEAGGRERRFVYSYTYRDWLIRAFNEDLSFDQFLLYQLAAEQLVKTDSPDKKHLAAMGFISLSKNGPTELVIDDRIDTTFRGMMGLTVSCARCHDHKFDPISTKEYYGLYGVFENSLDKEQPLISKPPAGPDYEKYLQEKAALIKKVDDFINPKVDELAKQKPELANRRAQLVTQVEREHRNRIRTLRAAVDKFVANRGMEGDRALIVKDRAKIRDAHVFVRGNRSRRGELAPRQFPSIATADNSEPILLTQGSGRLDMARAIVDAQNPLTARVIVNRVWMWHFGEGIVRTVSDFGTQGELPDHPELLDWLASWFIENGWSIQKLHQLILSSESWAQQSQNPMANIYSEIDPENRLLWKFARKRLQLEQMRDGMLAASGQLDRTLYGRAIKILEEPYSPRRSVYAYIDRQNLNPVFRSFDFSNPQESTGKRPATTIPMQALFTLNSDFVKEKARNLEALISKEEDRIGALHQAVFSRDPSEADRQLAESFVTSFQSAQNDIRIGQTNGPWSYGYGFVDETEQTKVHFTPFPYWTGDSWQIEKQSPVKNSPLSYLRVEKSGKTHPGHTTKESLVYRWEAPRKLRLQIESTVYRKAVGKGNGVLVRIVSSRDGILEEADLHKGLAEVTLDVESIELDRGDLLWFLIDSKDKNASFDSVTWAPILSELSSEPERWNFEKDFSGPFKPQSVWQTYAQALLNSNRFLFID